MPKVAFLSMTDMTGFVSDDELARAPLAARGWGLETVPWNADVAWNQYDAVVLRSTWDYQDDLPAFLSALDRIEESGTFLYNPRGIVEWNAKKTYMNELAARGVPVVPTRFGRSLPGPDLDSLFSDLGTDDLVIKPSIGASAFDTFRVRRGGARPGPAASAPTDRTTSPTVPSVDPVRGRFGGAVPILDLDDEAHATIARTFRDREYMAQPFVPEVLDPGEHSIFFFGGRFSHAILKRPKPGDFRVQEEHGGEITPADIPLDLVEACRAIVGIFEPEPLYARVDIVRRGELFLLMELELIEPALYFRVVPGSAERFVDALLARVATDRRERPSPAHRPPSR